MYTPQYKSSPVDYKKVLAPHVLLLKASSRSEQL
jgi:hypothetical protein